MSNTGGNDLPAATAGAIVGDGIDEGPADPSTEKVYRIFDYLETAQGHEIANATVALLRDGLQILDKFKTAALSQSTQNARFEKILQVVVIGVVVAAVCGLTYVDKFNSPVALLLGTLVGYVFGRK